VLHSDANVIFAIASGMKILAFRLPDAAAPEALAEGAQPCEVGAEWFAFDPFTFGLTREASDGLLVKWCATAFRYAQTFG
jgi:hypothetical protein